MTQYDTFEKVETDQEIPDEERNSPSAGGCWICETGNGNTDSGMVFDFEFDTWVHITCLEEHGVESVLEYEQA